MTKKLRVISVLLLLVPIPSTANELRYSFGPYQLTSHEILHQTNPWTLPGLNFYERIELDALQRKLANHADRQREFQRAREANENSNFGTGESSTAAGCLAGLFAAIGGAHLVGYFFNR